MLCTRGWRGVREVMGSFVEGEMKGMLRKRRAGPLRWLRLRGCRFQGRRGLGP